MGYCHACITHLIGLFVRDNVILFLYSASESIHHRLIETEEIMDLTVFATLRRLHQFINFASFLYDYKSSLIEVAWSGRASYLLNNTCIIISN